MVVSKMSMLTFNSKHYLPNIKMLYSIFMHNFFKLLILDALHRLNAVTMISDVLYI